MSYLRLASALSAGALALCLANSAHADALSGTTITQTAASRSGTTLNANAASASVGSGIEFTNVLSVPGLPSIDLYQDFSDSGFTLSFATASGSLQVSNSTDPLLTFTYTDSAFTDPYAFQGYTCTANSICDPVPASNYSTSFSGSTLTVNIFGLESGESLNFAPSATATVTPEPGSLALTLTGLLGTAGMVRRRLRTR